MPQSAAAATVPARYQTLPSGCSSASPYVTTPLSTIGLTANGLDAVALFLNDGSANFTPAPPNLVAGDLRQGIASSDLDEAYAAARLKINLDQPGESRLVLRLRDGHPVPRNEDHTLSTIQNHGNILCRSASNILIDFICISDFAATRHAAKQDISQ